MTKKINKIKSQVWFNLLTGLNLNSMSKVIYLSTSGVSNTIQAHIITMVTIKLFFTFSSRYVVRFPVNSWTVICFFFLKVNFCCRISIFPKIHNFYQKIETFTLKSLFLSRLNANFKKTVYEKLPAAKSPMKRSELTLSGGQIQHFNSCFSTLF